MSKYSCFDSVIEKLERHRGMSNIYSQHSSISTVLNKCLAKNSVDRTVEPGFFTIFSNSTWGIVRYVLLKIKENFPNSRYNI